jgi:tetratricopeptide (TPR) repeat protein
MSRKLLIQLCVFVALVCLTAVVWIQTGEQEAAPEDPEKVEMTENLMGDLVPVESEASGLADGARILIRGLVFLLLGLYGAFMFITYVLPNLVHRATQEMYGSGAEVETDPMHDARALFAQGDYHGAIRAYHEVATSHPDDRFPWVEMAKIHNDNLEDPDAAIAVLKEGLESHEWTVNNAAFFLFRIAELYEKEKDDSETTVQLLRQIVELFPETRHSANATHRLREMGAM